MPLDGFDPEFRDLPHYIYAITARIWEGRGIDLIDRYYAADCPVRSPTGLVVGAKDVIKATEATLAEFPDRRLLGEDVVWKKHGKGYLSSHRIISTATHSGDGAYGKATGRSMRYRIIADCWCADNQVVEEWLIRDQGAIARCLGMEPRELAEAQAASGNAGFFLPRDDVPSDYSPEESGDEDARAYARLCEAAWADGGLGATAERYHHAASVRGPGGIEWTGRDGAARFWESLATAVEGPAFKVEDLFCCDNERGRNVAMRWSVTGRCSGKGILDGGDTGKDVYIMGLSHARFVDGRIDVEWVVLDEVAAWKQVL